VLKTLEQVNGVRQDIASSTDRGRKSDLGQFMTPSNVATFMASLFRRTQEPACHLLDAGAGAGSLSSAFIERWASGGLTFEKIDVSAFEIDDALMPSLVTTLATYSKRLRVVPHVQPGDFIELAVNRIQFNKDSGFTHAILNPPYKKINSNSHHRQLLRQVGVETVNLYTAFVALAVAMMEPKGQIVAIIPRSFCNGPYYKPFREFILDHVSIRQMHLFGARDKAFKDDKVLQENIIIFLERGSTQGPVTVSTSTDDSFADYSARDHPFSRIVSPTDKERFIHVPTSARRSAIERSNSIRHTLAELQLAVSTGPVVDFRLRNHLRDMPQPATVPLLYSGHFSGQTTVWPRPDLKKPNAIVHNDETEKWLYPTGFYTVVRRFSSKEERRRIVASVVEPAKFHGAKMLGFENHLNVFHDNKRGLPEDLARGLAVFLNATAVDDNFRQFNGHTQVNATDLRTIKYPNRAQLVTLGKWAMKHPELSQELIDEKLKQLDA